MNKSTSQGFGNGIAIYLNRTDEVLLVDTMLTKEKILLRIAEIKSLMFVCFKNEKKEYTQVEKNENVKPEKEELEPENEPAKFCIE